ncbi:hypothetical protein LF817_15285 [Halobacillus sp. A1]|uniref:hypothetical protein n=1 Tax=Halobacillus sp. A1 TaxID=2880262 RepID=UPI0020A63D14|nr:hypothetical protein [Halobacillus sp. A1]MCP3032686.1 hypothetical protein [Halobacillus sp. A1]
MSKSDKEIEQILSDLPPITDSVSKNEYLRNIQLTMEGSSKKRLTWLLPGACSFAGLMILSLLFPTPLDEVSEVPLNEEPSLKNAPLEKTETFSTSSVEHLPGLDDEVSDRALVSSSMETYVYRAVPDTSAQYIIPLSVPQNKGTEEEIIDKFSNSETGLGEDRLEKAEILIDEENREAVIVFPDGFEGGGIKSSHTTIESIRWTVAPYKVNSIRISNESGKGVPFHSKGELDSIDPIKEGEYAFQLFNGSSRNFLIPFASEANGRFENVLSEMKKVQRNERTRSAIFEGLHFLKVEEMGETITLEFDIEGSADSGELNTSVEAILVTAGQFGFDSVKFEHENLLMLGSYDISSELDVPEYTNPIEDQE